MARYNGREITIDWETTTIVGVQSKQFTINNEHVDVTTDDDNGWKTMLADPGTRSVEVTVSGITEDQILIAAMMAASVATGTVAANLPTASGASLGGEFFCTSLEGSGEHDGSYEFSVTFESSGAVTYTAGS